MTPMREGINAISGRVFRLLLAAGLMGAVAQAKAAPEAEFSRAELKAYFAMQQKLYPKNGDQFRKLVHTFGEQETYTAAQITAITDPKVSLPKIYDGQSEERGPALQDSLLRPAVEAHLREYEKAHPKIKDKFTATYPADKSHSAPYLVKVSSLMEALEWKYGKHSWYLAVEVRDVEENGIGAKSFIQNRLPSDPVRVALKQARSNDFKGLLIRQSWRDVLSEDEDEAQTTGISAVKDLTGATVSFTRNNLARLDTWTINGALIAPWRRNFPAVAGVAPVRLVLAPSVTVARIDTNGDPKNETDTVLYRFGAYGDWLFKDNLGGLEVRAAAVCATNTGHDAFLPGAEIDFEPRWHNDGLPIGYTKHLWHKAPTLDDGSDQSLMDIQFRIWLHMEGGDVHDAGKTWDAAAESFFRLGPVAQMQVNFPRTLFGRSFSITALYSYLPDVVGPEGHQTFFSVTGAYDLIKDDLTGNKISINGQYQKGALNFTKENVDTFTIGLGIRF